MRQRFHINRLPTLSVSNINFLCPILHVGLAADSWEMGRLTFRIYSRQCLQSCSPLLALYVPVPGVTKYKFVWVVLLHVPSFCLLPNRTLFWFFGLMHQCIDTEQGMACTSFIFQLNPTTVTGASEALVSTIIYLAVFINSIPVLRQISTCTMYRTVVWCSFSFPRFEMCVLCVQFSYVFLCGFSCRWASLAQE